MTVVMDELVVKVSKETLKLFVGGGNRPLSYFLDLIRLHLHLPTLKQKAHKG